MRHVPLVLVLFSPAIVLAIWSIFCAADDGYVSASEMMIFLAVLAVCVTAAEIARSHLRHKNRR